MTFVRFLQTPAWLFMLMSICVPVRSFRVGYYQHHLTRVVLPKQLTYFASASSSHVFSLSASSDDNEEEAVAASIVDWSSRVAPAGTQLLITDIDEDSRSIPMVAMFWNVVHDLHTQRQQRQTKSSSSSTTDGASALLAFPKAQNPSSFMLSPLCRLVQDLDLGIVATVWDDGPCPAIYVDYRNCGRDDDDDDNNINNMDIASKVEEMQRWVQDVIVDSRVCPYTQSTEVAGTGVPGVVPGKIGYPVCDAVGSSATATIAILASFWNNCIDLLNSDPARLSTILLCAPYVAATDSHQDFVRVSDAILKSLQLARANQFVSLVFFHPLYDRHKIEPKDRLVHGHLPPQEWLPSYLALSQEDSDIQALSADDLSRANYQRRSPFFVINVLRADQVQKAENVVPWEVLQLESERRVRVSGASIYARNTWRLATMSSLKQDPVSGYEYRVVAK